MGEREDRKPHEGSGLLVAVEGIDGSGKGTVVHHQGGLLNCLRTHVPSLSVFDIDEWQRSSQNNPELNPGNDHRPRYDDDNVKGVIKPRTPGLKEANIILVSEPTYSGTGRDVRFEMIEDNGRTYSAVSAAQAFSIDREVLDRRLILPALKDGKIVIKSRCMVTSLVYQPIQAEQNGEPGLTPWMLTSDDFAGNRHQLLYCAPDLLIIQTLGAGEAMRRLEGRKDKQDGAIFENLSFQQKLAVEYQSDWLREMFENRGTRVVYVNAEQSPEMVARDASSHLEALLRERK